MSFTHSELPTDSTVHGELGAPLGVLVTPFIGRSDGSHLRMDLTRTTGIASNLSRCSSCFAYMNPYCEVSNFRWFCSLCLSRNSFSKEMTRYRSMDPKGLPEMNQLMVDFMLPVSSARDEIPVDQNGVSSSGSAGRDLKLSPRAHPMVHVFLVQESMPADCMQSVTESLSRLLHEMHQDFHVVLLTYSNRVGIYRCSLDGLEQKSQEPTVQFAHFHASSQRSKSALGSVFEASEAHEVSGQGESAISKPYVSAPWHLSEVCPFLDATYRVGDARFSIMSAIDCVQDHSPIEATGGAGDSIPTNMVGPALEAVVDWILEADSPKRSAAPSVLSEEKTGIAGTISELLSSGSISDLVNSIGNALVGNVDDGERERTSSQSESRGGRQPLLAPIDLCCGVSLHIFLSSSQDLPNDSHPSVTKDSADSTDGSVNSKWIKDIATRCATKGLSVNFWGVASFESDIIGLTSWLPLASATGGRVYRSILGSFPSDERALLSEKLMRAINSQTASKCLLKIRSSPSLVVGESSAVGNMIPDPSLPGVYRMASAAADSCYSFSLGVVQSSQRTEKVEERLVVQVAFQYNTLVEAAETDLADIGEEDKAFAAYLEEENAALGTERKVVQGYASFPKNLMNPDQSNQKKSYVEMFRENFDLSKDYESLTIFKIEQEAKLMAKAGSSLRPRKDVVQFDCDWKSCRRLCSDKKSRLVVVRRLRIISFLVHSTPKISRLLRVMHAPTVAALLSKQMVSEIISVLQSECFTVAGHVSLSSKSLQVLRETSEIIQEWAGMYISSIARLNMTGEKPSKADAKAAVQSAIRAPPQLHLLRLLYGTRNLFRCNKAIPWNPDQVADLSSVLFSCDAYRAQNLLYPLLLSISSTSEIRPQVLPLKRDAMIINAAGGKSFLLETGNELVLYQLVPSMTSRSMESLPVDEIAQKPAAAKSGGGVLTFLSAPLMATVSPPPPPQAIPVHPATQAGTQDALAEDKFWLLNYLHNKLALAGTSPLRSVISQAGTYSSVYFMEHLIEDSSDATVEQDGSTFVGPNSLNQSFDAFIEIVGEKSVDLLVGRGLGNTAGSL